MMKLNKKDIEDIIALTSLQKGLLFHYLRTGMSDEYVEQISLQMKGPLDFSLVEQAWTRVIAGNGILRAVYRWEEAREPLQIILREYQGMLRYFDATVAGDPATETAVFKNDLRKAIDLQVQPFVVALCKTGEHAWEMVITNHHILYDGWSSAVMIREFFHYYNKPQAAGSQKTPFIDFIKWLQAADKQAAGIYWKQYLEGYGFRSLLPQLQTQRATGVPMLKQVSAGPALYSRLQAYARQNKVSFATLIYTAWGMLLQLYNNTDDVVFGITTSGRPPELPAIADTVGLFINTLPLRLKTGPGDSIADWLHATGTAVANHSRHSALPLPDIQAYAETNHLFDTLLVFQNYPLPEDTGEKEIEITGYEFLSRTHYDLTLAVYADTADVKFNFIFNDNRFSTEYTDRLTLHFVCLLDRLTETDASAPGTAVTLANTGAPPVQNEAAAAAVLSLPRTIAGHARLSPHKTALTFNDRHITYAMLHERVAAFSSILTRQLNVCPGDYIGILASHSDETVIWMLAVLHAGGVFVMINPRFPSERICLLLEDVVPKVLIAEDDVPGYDEAAADRLQTLVPHILHMQQLPVIPEAGDEAYLAADNDPCYVMYTSGTTGRPRGVVITHGAVSNYTGNFIRTMELSPADRVAQQASLTFDTAIEEIFPVLITGGTLVIIPDESRSGAGLVRLMQKEHITLLSTLPSAVETINQAIDSLPGLRVLVSGGDVLRREQVDRLSGRVKLYNTYGPTETTICATYHEINDADSAGNIGRPIDGYYIYICDENMRLQPAGIPGELYIGGKGVAAGYLNNPEATRQRFVADPYSKHRIVYRTGDTGQWLQDGTIAFTGRKDQQVKINGVRIELPEIEQAILLHPQVGNAVVMAVKQNGRTVLAAFLEAVETPNVAALRTFLADILPGYMVPVWFRTMPSFPLLGNGKTDRQRLQRMAADMAIQEPSFVQLADTDIQYYREAFEHTNATLLNSTNAKPLWEKLKAENVFIRSYTGYGQPLLPLSCSQRMIYFNEKKFVKSGCEINAATVKYKYELVHELMEQAFNIVLKKNDGFRLRIVEINNGNQQVTAQYVAAPHYYKADYLDFSNAPDHAYDTWVHEKTQAHIELIDKDLFYFAIIRFKNNDYGYYLKMHHIISDGWAYSLLYKELDEIYQQLLNHITPDETPNASYLDTLVDEEEYLVSEQCTADRAYWMETVYPLPPSPLNAMRKNVEEDPRSDRRVLPVPDSLRTKMHLFCKEHNSSLYKLYLGALAVYVCGKYGGDDLVIGSVSHGRTSKRQRVTQGMFLRFLPVRIKLNEESTFLSLVKNNCSVPLFGNLRSQRYPFDLVAREITDHTKQYVEYLADIFLIDIAGIPDTHYEIEHNYSFYEPNALSMQINPSNKDIHGLLELDWRFQTNQFTAADILQIHEDLVSILEKGLDDPYTCIRKQYAAGASGKTEQLLPAACGGIRKIVQLPPDGARAVSCWWLETDSTFEPSSLEALMGVTRDMYIVTDQPLPGKDGEPDLALLRYIAAEMSRPVPAAELTDQTEKGIAAIWASILQLDKETLLPDTHFFASGGHSLHAVTLASWLMREFDVKVSLRDLFVYPTIRAQASLVRQRNTTACPPIQPAARSNAYPLSSPQQRQWLLHNLAADSTAYNMPQLFRLEGKLDEHRLENAFTALIERHEILRTSFYMEADEVRQLVHESFHFSIPKVKAGEATVMEELSAYIQPFDLSAAPLIRATLFELEQDKWLLLADLHHIVSDGLSQEILAKEIVALYKDLPLLPLPLQYKDYAVWQGTAAYRNWIQLQETFWLGQMQGEIPVLQMPLDFPRPAFQQFTGDVVSFDIAPATVKNIRQLARDEGATLFMVLLEMCYAWLGRITGQQDLIIGVPVSGRQQELQGLIGMFVNTLALRHTLDDTASVKEALRNIKAFLQEAFRYQDYPFERLTEQVLPVRDPARNPLFDVMFVLTEEGSTDFDLPGLSVIPCSVKSTSAKFDMLLEARVRESGISIVLEYNAAIFRKESVTAFAGYLQQLIDGAAANPGRRMADIAMAAPQEILPAAHVPAGVLTDLWYQRLTDGEARLPALVWNGGALSALALERQSNMLGNYLREHGMGRNKVVAVMMDRCPEMIIAILGILKTGAAYLPLDPALPAARIAYMLEDSAAGMVVTAGGDTAKLPLAASYVDITGRSYRTADPDTSPLTDGAMAADAAYIIYTSGTTGIPKGVLVSHGAAMNTLKAMQHEYPLGPGGVFLFKTSFAFDVSVSELFGWMYGTGKLAVLEKDGEKDPHAIIASITRFSVTHVNFVPSMFNLFAELLTVEDAAKLRSLRYIFLAGEALHWPVADLFRELLCTATLVNVYGPTEAAIYATHYELPEQHGNAMDVPVGKPLNGVLAVIIDSNNSEQPDWIPGELLIAGAGLADGYLNNPELTAKQFIFLNGQRLYRTGDYARKGLSRHIHFMGRIDHQIKLKGFRIEIAEVESHLKQLSYIREAVVVVDGPADMPSLTAYITGTQLPAGQDIAADLSKVMPYYMVPSAFVKVDMLPLNASGKLDRKALVGAGPAAPAAADTPDSRTNDTVEERMQNVWSQVLNKPVHGVHENFFAIGGDSIKAVRIISRLQAAGISIRMKDIFQHPTVAALAQIAKLNGPQYEQGPVTGRFPLMPVQQWFFSFCQHDRGHYNQGLVLKSKKRITPHDLKQAFERLLVHHDMLRATFTILEDTVVQELLHPGNMSPAKIYEADLRESGEETKAFAEAATELQRFNPAEAPLFRIGLFHLKDGDRLLLLAHHLIVDVVSWKILLEDLQVLLLNGNVALPPKSAPYGLGAEAFRRLSAAVLHEQHAYWEALAARQVPELPQKVLAEDNLVGDSDYVVGSLGATATQALLNSTKDKPVFTIEEMILAAVAAELGVLHQRNEILIAMENHGRAANIDIDISRTVGWFTSIYPVLLPAPVAGPLEQLFAVKDVLRRVPEKGAAYGSWRFDENNIAVSVIAPDISFNYIGEMYADWDNPLFELAGEPAGSFQSATGKRPFLLDVVAAVKNGNLEITVTYPKKAYQAATIRQLLERINSRLEEILLLTGTTATGKMLMPVDLTYQQITASQLETLKEQYDLQELYPLSPMQEGILFHTLYDDVAGAYFEQASYLIEGTLHLALVRRALQLLMERHEILRANVITEPAPCLVVSAWVEAQLEYEELPEMDDASSAAECNRLQAKDLSKGFNPAKDRLLRLTVIKINEQRFRLIWSFHHIILDGWCLQVLQREFAHCYRALVAGEPVILPPAASYRNYIQWLSAVNRQASQVYWDNYLEGYETHAGIRPDIHTTASGQSAVMYRLSRAQTDALTDLAAVQHVTLSTLFQGLWGILLAKHNNTRDVVFGAVVSGRPPEVPGIEEMLGLFINTVPVRINYQLDTRFSNLLQERQQQVLQQENHQYFALAEIQNRTAQKNDLIDHILVFENYRAEKDLEGLLSANADVNWNWKLKDERFFERNNYKFSITIVPGDQLQVIFKYDRNLYSKTYINDISKRLDCLVNQVIADVEMPVTAMSLLSENNQRRLQRQHAGYEQHALLTGNYHRQFEEQAAAHPGNMAVVWRQESMSYATLNMRANGIAHGLIQLGVKKGDRIGILVKPCAAVISGILGILKAGAIFFPVDNTQPPLRFMPLARETGVTYLLDPGNTGVVYDDLTVLPLSDPRFAPVTENLGIPVYHTDGAYMIATSGTTGVPKGTVVSHGNLLNYAGWFKTEAGISYNDSSLVVSSLAFDLGFTGVFPLLIAGGRVHLTDYDTYSDPGCLLAALNNTGATILKLTPSLLATLVHHSDFNTDSIAQLRLLVCGGEKIKSADIDLLFAVKPGIQVMNHYGPTETTIGTVFCMISSSNWHCYRQQPVIGKPVYNAKAVIIGRDGHEQPYGIPGELYISGAGTGIGYINQPQLTMERFVFRNGERWYRTGDLVFRKRSGEIVFLDRIDEQVKIRGFRVEPGELESLCLQHEAILQAAVVPVKNKQGDYELTAFLVLCQSVGREIIADFLKKAAPSFLVPRHIIFLDELPLTSNNKVDKKKLAEMVLPGGEGALYDRLSPDERTLARIWSDLLQVGLLSLDRNADFFASGGHSLSAMQLLGKVRNVFGVSLSVKDVFENPKLGEQVRLITGAQKSDVPPLLPLELQAHYKASPAQKRFYLLQQIHKDITAYNMYGLYRLQGIPDAERLNAVFRQLLKRHEILRTSFELKDGELVQIVKAVEAVNTTVPVLKIDKAALKDWVYREMRPFDLSEAPLIRMYCLDTGETDALLLVEMHHIISDGISNEILIEDFNALLAGKPLREQTIQYKDYAAWQRSDSRQAAYWLERFSGDIPRLNLPLDYERPAVKQFDGATVVFEIPAAVTAALRKTAAEEGATLFMAILAVYKIFLQRITGQHDVVVGIPVSGRNDVQIEKVIGCFINTLAIRSESAAEESFTGFLGRLKILLLEAYDHQEFSFEELIDQLNVERNMAGNPLFDVMFDYHNEKRHSIENWLQLDRDEHFHRRTAMFDLNLHVTEVQDHLVCELEYCEALFGAATVERFASFLQRLAESAAAGPWRPVKQLNILDQDEQSLIVNTFNDTGAVYEQDLLIHQLFERAALRSPHRVAVVTDQLHITYRLLNERANQLAHSLMTRGLKPGDFVPVIMERSEYMIMAVLAILKAGGAYVPLEPDLPCSRLRHIVQQLDTKFLFTSREVASAVGEVLTGLEHTPLVYVPDAMEGNGMPAAFTWLGAAEMSLRPVTDPAPVGKASDLAYIIFTSGSSGVPKGVMVKHRPVINLIEWVNGSFGIDETTRLLFVTSLGFDLSVYDIFGLLASGGCIRITTAAELRDAAVLVSLIERECITFWDSAPAAFLQCISFLPEQGKKTTLRLVFFSGDWIPVNLPDLLRRAYPLTQVISLGGATEATVWSNYYPIEVVDQQWKSIPYGKPIQNARYYILDEDLNVCPFNIAGDLYIGGPCLSSGYFKDAALTAEKFIKSPFVSGDIIYKTGDLARWKTDGNMELLGRKDQQVKIRGHRIETGEIESQLLEIPGVKAAVAVVHGTMSTDKALAVYFCSDGEMSGQFLKDRLGEVLPAYMIPTYFIQLDTIPLTANGKVNRKALPEPVQTQDTHYRAPVNDTEKLLQSCWAEVLKMPAEKIGAMANFFELGGNSLKASLLVGMCYKAFHVRIPLVHFFQYPNIQSMATFFDNENAVQPGTIVGQKTARYPVTTAQQRLYVLQQMYPDAVVYNISQVIALNGDIDASLLENAFCTLIRRHEVLRTAFVMEDNVLLQEVSEEVNFSLIRFPAGNTDEQVKHFIQPFQLDKPQLIRVALITKIEGGFLLVVDLHHIIADGIAVGLLMEELLRLYNGVSLPPVTLQYRDYTSWKQQHLPDDLVVQQREYWKSQLGGEIPVLQLPADFPRPPVKVYEGSKVYFNIDHHITTAVKQDVIRHKTTLFIWLFTAYNIFLSRLSGLEDLVVGTPVSLRDHPDLQYMMGLLINTLAIRSHVPEGSTFPALLQQTSRQLFAALENKDYPFDELAGLPDVTRDASRNPVFDTMFVLDTSSLEEAAPEEISIQPYFFDSGISKFDLTLFLTEQDGALSGYFEYDIHLFKRDTIQRICDYFSTLVAALVQTGSLSAASYNMIPLKETELLTTGFNTTASKGLFPFPTIQTVFSEQVKKTPGNTALIDDSTALSYAELDLLSDHIAGALAARGIKPGDVVAILTDPCNVMLTGILGILKVGAAYLPVSTKVPEERKNHMLQEAGAVCLLVRNAAATISAGVPVWGMEEMQADTEQVLIPVHNGEADNLAYIIYTSGSTGNPKGVMVTHQNVLNTMAGLGDILYRENQLNIALTAACEFDGSVHVILGALLFGNTLLVVPEERKLDQEWLYDFFHKNKTGLIEGVPGYMTFLANAWKTRLAELPLKFIVCGGEPLTSGLVDNLLNNYTVGRDVTVVNIYGPTETCIGSTCSQIRSWHKGMKVTIGSPLPGERVYILDKLRQLAPLGVYGQLCISGQGVTKGYINAPALNAEKFVPDPFLPGQIMYCTGDQARWLPDGTLECIGRLDTQVKIRGYRLEITEIEDQLLAYGPIEAAAVSAGADNEFLCAYFTAGEKLEAEDVKAFLSVHLPAYAIPNCFIQLEQLPLNSNGKVDRAKLSADSSSIPLASQQFQLPATGDEYRMTRLWGVVLGIPAENIGVEDDFFERGGHSLRATTLAALIHEEFNARISIVQLFRHTTVRSQAALLKSIQTHVFAGIPVALPRPFYPLSQEQKRLYFMQLTTPDSITFNLPQLFEIDGEPDINRIRDAFRLLISGHDILRTAFVLAEDDVYQEIHPEVDFDVVQASWPGDEDLFLDENTTPFDLSVPCQVRVIITQASTNRYYLLIDLHHIITDGISNGLLVQEFADLYNQQVVTRTTLQYRDYAVWQAGEACQLMLKQQGTYWQRALDGVPPVLKPGSAAPDNLGKGCRVHFDISGQLLEKVIRCCDTYQVTPYILLLTAYAAMLSAQTSQYDIVIGSPVSGRTHAGLQRVIGLMTNLLPMRCQPLPEKSFEALLREVRGTVLHAFEHQNYPFNEMVKKTGGKREGTDNPLFSVQFSFENEEGRQLEIPGLRLNPCNRKEFSLQFRQSLYGTRREDRFCMTFEYLKGIYTADEVQHIINSYVSILEQVIFNPAILLHMLNIQNIELSGNAALFPSR